MRVIGVFPKNYGEIVLESRAKGANFLVFKLSHFKPFATHALHIHEYGDISDGCQSLGAHYNPTNQDHGLHAGDLLFNIKFDKNGFFNYQHETNLKPRDILGRSFVIHDSVDDLGVRGSVNYSNYSNFKIANLFKKLGYKLLSSRDENIKYLERESLLTGNAGRRLVCTVIGLARS